MTCRSEKILQCTLYGALTGIVVGSVGALFQLCIHWLLHERNLAIQQLTTHLPLQCLLAIFFATLLMGLSLFIVRIVAGASGSGVQEIQGTLAGKSKMRWQRILPAKFIGCVLSLSSGLVLGREGPTIQMGGAIGQLIKTVFHLDKEQRHILIAAGAGAGLATTFNAPLAGIIFVIEGMRHQFRFSFKAFHTVVIACVIADISLQLIIQISHVNLSQMMAINMATYQTMPLSSLWLFVIFGIILGLIGTLFNTYLVKSLNFFSRRNGFNFWKWIVLIGIITGILMVTFPAVIGGGYAVIPAALHGNMSLNMLLTLLILRFFTSVISYGTGVPGGIFAPMLALGSIAGMLFGSIAQIFFPHLIPHPQVFAVAGMSALFTATVGAPLTAVVLLVKMTMNYDLILPLILTCFSAAISAMLMKARPIYVVLLSRTLVLEHKRTLYLKTKT